MINLLTSLYTTSPASQKSWINIDKINSAKIKIKMKIWVFEYCFLLITNEHNNLNLFGGIDQLTMETK